MGFFLFILQFYPVNNARRTAVVEKLACDSKTGEKGKR